MPKDQALPFFVVVISGSRALCLFFVELGASTVNIEIQFWTGSRQGDGLQTRDRVIDAVKRAMDDAGVSMPSDIVELAATRSFAQALRAGDREG